MVQLAMLAKMGMLIRFMAPTLAAANSGTDLVVQRGRY